MVNEEATLAAGSIWLKCAASTVKSLRSTFPSYVKSPSLKVFPYWLKFVARIVKSVRSTFPS